MRVSTSAGDAALMFVGLWLTYAGCGEYVPSNDATASVFAPVVVLESRSWTLTRDNAPFMFEVGPGPAREHYFLSPTRWAGHYVNNFGPLPGLFLLGPLALLRLLVGDLRAHVDAVWLVAKLFAAGCAALSGALMYLTARKLVTRGGAILIALSFGLATDVWPMASQSAFQQSFALPWLVLGCRLWMRFDDVGAGSSKAPGMSAALGCGACLGLAAAIRAPVAFYAATLGCALLISAWRAQRPRAAPDDERVGAAAARRRVVAYAAGVAMPLSGLLLYNKVVFETWSGFTALQRTDAAHAGGAWQTPVLEGLLGILFSPSRGLFFYTPLALFALYGARRVFAQPGWARLRPLALAAIPLVLTYAKWSNWWGGWCYGPRLLIDLLPIACLLLAPALAGARARPWLSAAFVVCLGVSAFNAALGALAYDLFGWDAREAYAVVDPGTRAADLYFEKAKALAAAERSDRELQVLHMDIDKPAFRHRLWSVRDSPLAFYLEHFEEARARRQAAMRRAVERARWD
jgi:hypothetical protein